MEAAARVFARMEGRGVGAGYLDTHRRKLLGSLLLPRHLKMNVGMNNLNRLMERGGISPGHVVATNLTG